MPEDLSSLEGVEDINLNGNMFQDLKQVILALTTMPSLRSLHINLHEEEQVDFIFRNMPGLSILNDTAVEREDFEGEGEGDTPGKEEEPHGDFQAEDGDMRNEDHPEDDPEEELEEEQLPQQHLDQEAAIEAEADSEAENINESEDGIEKIDIKPEDLEIIAVLYDAIRALRRRIDEQNDKNLAEDFDSHLKDVMSELNESMTTNDPPHVKNANLLKAKFSLYEI